MSRSAKSPRNYGIRILTLVVALSWVAADAAWASQGRAGASRSGSKSSSSSSASSAPSSSSSGQRSAVSRSSGSSQNRSPSSGSVRSRSSASGGSGAARTRTHRSTGTRHGGGHGGSSHYGHYGYYGYGYPSYWHPYWGYWGWSVGYGHGYGYGHYPPVVYSSHRGYRMGALDLKVRPKTTEIYVDGQYVGLAKQYDGFPGHLWLERGVYEISFYKPGFETQTRTVKILTDLILDMQIEMLSGEAVQPQMRLEPDRPEEADGDEIAQRLRRSRRGELQARLHLAVEPGNALVYLDGNVLGTGDELAGLHAGLILSAGTHTLEVVGSGFETVERQLVVEAGEEVDFALTLKPVEQASR